MLNISPTNTQHQLRTIIITWIQRKKDTAVITLAKMNFVWGDYMKIVIFEGEMNQSGKEMKIG